MVLIVAKVKSTRLRSRPRLEEGGEIGEVEGGLQTRRGRRFHAREKASVERGRLLITWRSLQY